MNNQKILFIIIFLLYLYVSLIGCVEPPLEPIGEPTSPPEGGDTGYERVLRIDGDGSVTYGIWNDAYNRIVNNLENCILRFDNRMAKPLYIEYAPGMIRFDFQSLDATYNASDAYAFIAIELDVKAGLGTSYRIGYDDHVWKKDIAQHADVSWNPFTVDVYCEPDSAHTLTASFNSGGGVVQGTWDDLYETVVTHGADCKVRFDNRILMPPHIEYGDDWFNFDALGLEAHYDGWDAFAYAHVTLNGRAGIGAAYRRGTAGEIYKKDREQDAEDEWRGMGIEVFCNDKYDEEFVFNSSGNLINNEEKTWEELYNLIVYEARDCKLIYDNRISEPRYIEFSNNILQFDFANLHAWHVESNTNCWDSFALFSIEYNNAASLQACYRRSYSPYIFLKTISQHSIDATIVVPVRIRCEKGIGYSRELSVAGNGSTMSGSLDELYTLLSSPASAYNIKLRQDNRITIPAIIEYGDTADDPVYFEYHPLAAYNNWECFGLTYMHKDNPSGLTGTYRRGLAEEVWKKTLDQHPLYSPIFQTDVDVFLKLDY